MSAIGSPWKGHVTAKDEGNTDENLSARHPYSTKQVGLARAWHTGFGLDFETSPIYQSFVHPRQRSRSLASPRGADPEGAVAWVYLPTLV